MTLGASPSPEIVVSRYEPGLYPKFRVIFESSHPNDPLHHIRCLPEEAATAVVIDNRSSRDITGLRYCWVHTIEDGSEKKQTVSSDSYMVEVYSPVLKSGDRKLICRSSSVDESLIDHVTGGGGFISASVLPHLSGIADISRLEIDCVLFADGEIAGPDSDKYGTELHCRRAAAEFVAKQIRLAESERRDVTPVLSALAEIPRLGRLRHSQGDPLVHWVQRHARDYLHALRPKSTSVNTAEARLRRLENLPALPKFYRRDGA